MPVRGHEKVLAGGQVRVPAGGRVGVPTPRWVVSIWEREPLSGDGGGANQPPHRPGDLIEDCEGADGHHRRIP
jgi:hypothetical protein